MLSMTGTNPLFLKDSELERMLGLIFSNYHTMFAELRQAMSDEQLDELDLRILYTLMIAPGETMTGLVAELGSTKQTLSRRIRNLVNRGILKEKNDDTDKRRKIFGLTDEGSEMLKGLTEQQKKRLRNALKGIESETVRGFENVLDRLNKNAQASLRMKL